MVVYSISIPICSWKYVGNVCDRSNKEIVEISNLPNVESLKGMWHSGSASALHAESPGVQLPASPAVFEWSRVRLTLGASQALIAQW